MRLLEPRAQPFYYPGGRTGCLLIHGFPGAPEEMRWLGKHLASQGISALGIRLLGHGTQPADLIRASGEQWLANVEDGYALLRHVCERVFFVGLSLGGVLALNVGRRLPAAGIVAMATPASLPPLVGRLRPILKPLSLIWRYRQPDEPSGWHDKEAEALNFHYPVQPVHAIAEVHDLVEATRAGLHEIYVPTLLIYSRNDQMVPPDDAHRIYNGISSEHKLLEWVEKSGHNLPRDAERQWVFERITSFVRAWSGGTS